MQLPVKIIFEIYESAKSSQDGRKDAAGQFFRIGADTAVMLAMHDALSKCDATVEIPESTVIALTPLLGDAMAKAMAR